MESCWRPSTGAELFKTGGWEKRAKAGPELQLTQPCETTRVQYGFITVQREPWELQELCVTCVSISCGMVCCLIQGWTSASSSLCSCVNQGWRGWSTRSFSRSSANTSLWSLSNQEKHVYSLVKTQDETCFHFRQLRKLRRTELQGTAVLLFV